MTKKSEQKVRRFNRLMIIITACIVAYTSVHLTVNGLELSKQQNYINQLKEDIYDTTNENDELLDMIEQGATREAIAAVAKEKLGLALPGERVIVDVGSK